jgi:hypothetical protein
MWGIPQRLHCFQEILMLLIQIDDMWLKFKPSVFLIMLSFSVLTMRGWVLYPSNSLILKIFKIDKILIAVYKHVILHGF